MNRTQYKNFILRKDINESGGYGNHAKKFWTAVEECLENGGSVEMNIRYAQNGVNKHGARICEIVNALLVHDVEDPSDG